MVELVKILEKRISNQTLWDIAISHYGIMVTGGRSYCIYLVNIDGKVINSYCTSSVINDTDYCCGYLGAVNNKGYVYIFDSTGKLLKKLTVSKNFDNAIKITPEGFIVCHQGCLYYTFKEGVKWVVNYDDIGAVIWASPAYYNGYFYAVTDRDPRTSKYYLVVIKDGKVLKKYELQSYSSIAGACNGRIAIISNGYLTIYDVSRDPLNPSKIVESKLPCGDHLTFSSYCKYLAVTCYQEGKLMIVDAETGSIVYSTSL